MTFTEEEKHRLIHLISSQRWAALATLSEEGPLASMVAYVPEPGFSGFLLHLSHLAAHTRNLLHDARTSLVITQADSGEGDPQTLARVSIQGRVTVLGRDSKEFSAARAAYIDYLPEAELLFGFSDFVLFRLEPTEARYIGGFARAYTLNGAQLQKIANNQASSDA